MAKDNKLLDEIRTALAKLPPDELRLVRAFIEGMAAARRAAAAGKDPGAVARGTDKPKEQKGGKK